MTRLRLAPSAPRVRDTVAASTRLRLAEFCDWCGTRERVRKLALGGRACSACVPREER